MRGAIGAARMGRWPSGAGRLIAALTLEPHELAGVHGASFVRYEADGLGPCEGAAVRLPSGRHLLFTRYDHQPGPGTLVEADWADDPADARRDCWPRWSWTSASSPGSPTSPRPRRSTRPPWKNFDADET